LTHSGGRKRRSNAVHKWVRCPDTRVATVQKKKRGGRVGKKHARGTEFRELQGVLGTSARGKGKVHRVRKNFRGPK